MSSTCQHGAPRSTVFFDAPACLVLLVTLLGLLLTFGAVFPPLAAALAATVCCFSYFTQLKLGRFVRLCEGAFAGAVSGATVTVTATGSDTPESELARHLQQHLAAVRAAGLLVLR